ncbi:MAG: sulfite exporter TauE/SafE family protein [Cyanobacteria bacterium J06639_1]
MEAERVDGSAIAILAVGGIVAGISAGVLGIGGGVLLVPLLVTAGASPTEAVGTSTLAIVLTATSGSIQNWRAGNLDWRKVLILGIPALITAQLGALLAEAVPSFVLLAGFGCLLLVNIALMGLRQNLVKLDAPPMRSPSIFETLTPRLSTGGAAGLLAGLFGVGGGVIMVPLQMLWLQEPIKRAIQTSLGVIVLTAISACLAHARQDNVLWIAGLILGTGGLVGAQLGARFLPKLPDANVKIIFRTVLIVLSIYTFWRAWRAFGG